jgi:predicted porin
LRSLCSNLANRFTVANTALVSAFMVSSLAHGQGLEPGKLDFTLYGIADLSLVNADSGFGHKTRVDGGGGMQASRLGFRANREFKSGITALATLEAGVQFDNGSAGASAPVLGVNDTNASSGAANGTGTRLFARQAFGGIRAPIGQITVGRQYTGSYIGGVGIGAAAWPDGFYGNPGLLLPLIGGMPTRVDNSIVYQSPSALGFSAVSTFTAGNENNVDKTTAVGTGATSVTDKAGRGVDLLVRYTNGPLTTAVSTWNINNASYNVTGGETALGKKRGVQLAANYNFGWMLVSGTFVSGRINGGNYESVTRTLSKADGWGVSARFPFGEENRHNLWLGYSALNDKSSQNRDAKMYGVAYWYQLEQNTRVYVNWGATNNNANGLYALPDAGNLVGNVTRTGVKPSGLQVGLNYNF